MYSRYDPTGRTVFRPLDAAIGGPHDAPSDGFGAIPDGYSGTTLVRDAAASADFAEARGGFADSGGFSRETSAAGEFSPGGDAVSAPSGISGDGAAASSGASEAGDADGGILSALRGTLGKLFGGDGILGGLDLGDVILLLILALLFLEDGKPGDLVILAAVALFIGL